MLQRPTAFVIGAGASRDFGFPVGGALAADIAQVFNLNFDYQTLVSGSLPIYEAVKRAIPSLDNQSAFDLCHRIRRGLTHYDSIDDYVEAANDDQVAVAAKIAIFDIIGRAERNSTLAGLGSPKSSAHVENLRTSWPAQLLRLALRGVRHSDISSLFENISVVSFNYDRALEHYLYWGLRDLGFSDEVSAQAMNSLEVFHPYGTLGPLPWQAPARAAVPFGIEHVDLAKTYGLIRTYSEQQEERRELHKIEGVVQNAETVVFLGFGFHKQNIDLLSGPSDASEPQTVFTTAYGVSNSQRRAFEARIRSAVHREAVIHMDDATCDDFFSRHGQEIAL